MTKFVRFPSFAMVFYKSAERPHVSHQLRQHVRHIALQTPPASVRPDIAVLHLFG